MVFKLIRKEYIRPQKQQKSSKICKNGHLTLTPKLHNVLIVGIKALKRKLISYTIVNPKIYTTRTQGKTKTKPKTKQSKTHTYLQKPRKTKSQKKAKIETKTKATHVFTNLNIYN